MAEFSGFPEKFPSSPSKLWVGGYIYPAGSPAQIAGIQERKAHYNRYDPLQAVNGSEGALL